MPLWAVLECTVRSLLQNNIGEVLLNTFGANTFGAVLQYTFEAILLQVLQCGHVVSQYYLLHIWAPLDCVNLLCMWIYCIIAIMNILDWLILFLFFSDVPLSLNALILKKDIGCHLSKMNVWAWSLRTTLLDLATNWMQTFLR